MDKASALVITVGGSPEPIIHSLSQHRPEAIYFIASSGSKGEVPSILQEAYHDGCEAKQHTFVVDDPNDLVSCFRRCHEVFEDIRRLGIGGENVIVDPTGGTKIMSAALLLAATELGLRVSYVGGKERTNRGLGVVVTGTEKILYSAHPYDILAKSGKERFCHYFNSYRFSPALDICNEIIERGSPRMKSIFKALRKIVEGYRDWDLFRYRSCLHSIESGLNALQRLAGQYPEDVERLDRFIEDVQENVVELKKTLDSLPKEKISFEMVEELLANAFRRAEEGKYDDAVARLYRALEMIAQWRFIAKFGRSTSKFPLELLDRDLRGELFPGLSNDSSHDIACKKAFAVLSRIGDDYGNLFRENYDQGIRALLDRRNNSITAHGAVPLDEKDFDRFYELFKNVFKVDGSRIRFPKLDSLTLETVGFGEGGA